MVKNKNKILKWILTTTVALIVIVLVGGMITMRLMSDHYRELFSQIHPGMTKNQIKEIVGDPIEVGRSIHNHVVYYYKVPSWFSESPTCYFGEGDSVLVRFSWDAIDVDTSLVIDSTKDRH